jgi:hypothetical protein
MDSQPIVDGLLGLGAGLILGALLWWLSYRSQRSRWLALLALPTDATGRRYLPQDWWETWSYARLVSPPGWLVWMCG